MMLSANTLLRQDDFDAVKDLKAIPVTGREGP
jgi:hypothetical protein